MPPNYRIAPDIFRLDSGYRRGLVLAQGVQNAPSNESLIGTLRKQEMALRAELGDRPIADHPRIAAWRDAYRRFGARPSEFRSSVEALARRVLRGDSLPNVNALVDIGNIVSLRYLAPVGVHPIPIGNAPLQLRLAEHGDTFQPPDGGPPESPAAGEVVFAQANSVLTRRWTWRQAAGTLTHVDTAAVYFNIDALSVVPDDGLAAAAHDLVDLIRTYCAGEARAAVLDAANPQLSPDSS
jgi:DNA/RNA-binding domain of Phe-tRNA-synthetase-like protein